MAEHDSTHTEEYSDSGPNESERQVPFDARKSIGWAQSATPEESRTAEVNSPEAWGDLVRAGGY